MGYIIYKHTNKFNGKVYIGQTHRSIKARWGKSGECYKQCSKFWNAIQKYGWDSFEHKILVEDIKTQIEANKLEQEYIEIFNSIKNGYNISKGGFDKSYCNIPVYKLDKDKNILAEFESAADAERILNIDRGSISKCCQQKAITAGGYYWCFKRDYKQYKIKEKSNILSREKAVEQLDKNTNEILNIYKSMSEAARALGKLAGEHIGHCCNGKRKTAYGYKWRFADEKRKNKN